jgi:fructosamine-3-kinase
MFITRAYNRFEFDPVYSTITKISKDEKLVNEAEYLNRLPKELSIFYPRILGSGESKGESFIRMEKYTYRNLGDIMVNDAFDNGLWIKVAERLRQILAVFLKHGAPVNRKEHSTDMYIGKTDREYKKLVKSNEYFEKISKHKQLHINGKKYINFSGIWNSIKSYITANLLANNHSVIHGDMCFSNILCGIGNGDIVLKLIDPKGSFGIVGIYGDPLYDWAKLRHSFEGGYEYMIYDKFQLIADSEMQTFQYWLSNDNAEKIVTVFKMPSFSPQSKLVEGLIFIGMCARHYDSIDRQTMMYLTGVRLLNEFLEEIK